jgi:hypothetical protein
MAVVVPSPEAVKPPTSAETLYEFHMVEAAHGQLPVTSAREA